MIFSQKFQMSGEPSPSDALSPEPSPAPAPAPPQTISIQDILNATEVLQTQEASDKVKLDAIGTLSFDSLRASLLQWGTRGFPNAYVIHEIPMAAPSVCSDGAVRNLTDYIPFCSGKTIQGHIAALQQRLPDISVSFAYSGTAILIVVSRLG